MARKRVVSAKTRKKISDSLKRRPRKTVARGKDGGDRRRLLESSREVRGWVNSGRGIAQEIRGVYRLLRG